MSIVFRDCRNDTIKVFCKGADNVIYERLETESTGKIWESTVDHLQRFACTGLRTLVCASRHMTPVHFSQWYSEHAAVRTALKGRHHLVGESCARAESDLELLAATVIEDLQSMELEI
eukprot:157730_1